MYSENRKRDGERVRLSETLEGLEEWLGVGNQRGDWPLDLGETCRLQESQEVKWPTIKEKKTEKLIKK